MLVSIGDGLVLNYYKDRLTLLVIRNRADFFRVFQTIQEICDKYDDWERRLYRDLMDDAGADRLVADSKEIIGCPIYVMDKSFRFIAASDAQADETWMRGESGNLNPESLSRFLSTSDLLMEKKNAMTLDLFDKKVLCVNLFDKADRYQGCLCIDLPGESEERGLEALAEMLAECLNTALERSPESRAGVRMTIKKVMQTLIEEQPLSRAQRVLLRSADNTVPYVCVVMRTTGKVRQQLPLSYICDVFEESVKDSSAFIKDDSIVAFLNVAEKPKDFRLAFHRKLKEFCTRMRLSAGISNEFTELFNIRMHYHQALSALEDGLLLAPDDTLFWFSSYALTEMVINSLGGLPVEAYYPDGLKAVIEHDRNSGVSYLETLRVLLEENLSYTATAQRLFIHRSTLLDRIDRIEKEMNIDLKNSEQRLQLEILLRAIDLETIIRRE